MILSRACLPCWGPLGAADLGTARCAAGVHAAQLDDQVAAGLADVRLPWAAGPLLLQARGASRPVGPPASSLHSSSHARLAPGAGCGSVWSAWACLWVALRLHCMPQGNGLICWTTCWACKQATASLEAALGPSNPEPPCSLRECCCPVAHSVTERRRVKALQQGWSTGARGRAGPPPQCCTLQRKN